MTIGPLLLAAGQSRRFGSQDKLTVPLEGRPMVAHALNALSVPQLGPRLAVVSSDAVALVAHDAGFEALRIPPGLPQAESLKAGLAHLRRRGITALVVALGDMPWIRAQDVARLLELAGTDAACCTCGDIPIPLALFPQRLFGAMAGLQGDRGAAPLLQSIPPERRLALPRSRLRDVDRPDDLPIHGSRPPHP